MKIKNLQLVWLSFWRKFRPPVKRTQKQQTGAAGEHLARHWLECHRNFKTLEYNVQVGGGEIDIIGWCGSVMVFVEVRSRHEDALVPGRRSITPGKLRTLRRACKAYLRHQHPPVNHYRFDVVEIRWRDEQEPVINHYENVALFRPRRAR